MVDDSKGLGSDSENSEHDIKQAQPEDGSDDEDMGKARESVVQPRFKIEHNAGDDDDEFLSVKRHMENSDSFDTSIVAG